MGILSREFLRAGDTVYRLHTQPVEALAGKVHIRITTVWAQARRPQDEQSQLSLTLTKHELKTLIEGLKAALVQS